MNKQENNERHLFKDDEIDLSIVALNIVNAIRRNLRILMFIIALGTLVGIIRFFLATPVYETSMVASSRLMTNVRVNNLITTLDNLVAERNDFHLSKKMRINPNLTARLVSIHSESIKEKADQTIVDAERAKMDDNVFLITIRTYDNQVIDSLEKGILYYLQHNEYVEKRTIIQKHNLETLRERVRGEVKKLDSLRFSMNQLISKGIGGNSTMLMSDPASVNKDIMMLYEKELKINEELELIDDIQVIQSFTPFTKPVSPDLIKNLAIGTGSSLILALIVIIIFEARRSFRKMQDVPEGKLKQPKEYV